MPARRRPAEGLAGGVLDWTASRHWARDTRPCRYCGRPTHLRDSAGHPADKVCAEAALAAQQAQATHAYRAQDHL